MRYPYLFAGALLLALAGCSSTQTTPATSTTHTPPAPKLSASPSPTPSLTPSPKSTVSTDLSACATGHCEVQVSASARITFKPGLEIDTLRVVSIANGVVTIDTTSTSNDNGGGAYANAGTCSTSGNNGNTTNQLSVGCLVTNNRLSISVLSVSGDTAVLQLAPVPG